jgi:hypothetical protein
MDNVIITIFALPVREKRILQSDTVKGNMIITIFALPIPERRKYDNLTQ